MSVINKMLRDLDKRGGMAPREASARAREIESIPLPREKGPARMIVAGAIATIVVVAGALFLVPGLHFWEKPDVSAKVKLPVPTVTTPTITQAAPKVAAAPSTPLATNAVATESSPKESTATPAVAAQPAQAPAAAAESPKVAMAEPPKASATETAKVAAPEQAKATQAAPPKAATPEPAKTAQVAPPKAATPEPAKAPAPEPAKIAQAAPARAAVAEVAKVAPPEPAKAAVPEPAKVAIAITPAADPSVQGATRAPAPDTARSRISVDRQEKSISRAESAAAQYRIGGEWVTRGQVEPAMAAYAEALRLDPSHFAARQALVVLLLERGQMKEAQDLLREGVKVAPGNTSWTMLLARLQVEAGDAAGAVDTLEKGLPNAANQPEYRGFLATVLQMQSRHREAIAHYEASVRLAPDSGRWLTGLGISLEEEKRIPEARDAFRRALDTNTLGRDLQSFVERKLRQMQ